MLRAGAIGLALAMALPAAAQVELDPRRLQQWVQRGGDSEVVDLTFHRIDRFGSGGPGSWVDEWSAVGAHYAARAERAAARGDRTAALADHLRAVVYYSAAKFPDNRTPAQRAAYARHLEQYRLAGQYFPVPLEVVEIPFGEHRVIGYLHLPEGVEKPPLVIWSNGIDTHKADTHARLKPALARGLAVLTVDSPGTGESNFAPASPEAGRMYSAILDHMLRDARVDATRVAQIGISFGGNFAARQAFLEPRLDAVVAMCPLVDEAVPADPEYYARAPEQETMRALAAALAVPEGDWAAIAERAAPLSLGPLIASRRVPMPLLVANGDRDSLVPLADLHRLAGAAERADLWIFGGSGHCAGDYAGTLYPKMADWLADRLGGG